MFYLNHRYFSKLSNMYNNTLRNLSLTAPPYMNDNSIEFGLFLLLNGVGDEQAGVLLLIQQHHGSQVSYAFFTVARASNHPNALHLV